jgi:hypothetical protein
MAISCQSGISAARNLPRLLSQACLSNVVTPEADEVLALSISLLAKQNYRCKTKTRQRRS